LPITAPSSGVGPKGWRCQRKRVNSSHRSEKALEEAIRGWIASWNQDPRPFAWVKTAEEILETLAAYCQRISDSGH
jgi:hypothetical protein